MQTIIIILLAWLCAALLLYTVLIINKKVRVEKDYERLKSDYNAQRAIIAMQGDFIEQVKTELKLTTNGTKKKGN